jgi:hypothetical protein
MCIYTCACVCVHMYVSASFDPSKVLMGFDPFQVLMDCVMYGAWMCIFTSVCVCVCVCVCAYVCVCEF